MLDLRGTELVTPVPYQKNGKWYHLYRFTWAREPQTQIDIWATTGASAAAKFQKKHPIGDFEYFRVTPWHEK